MPNRPGGYGRVRRAWSSGPRRRRCFFGAALAAGLAALVSLGVSPSLANHAPPACTNNQQQGTLCVTVSDTPDPVENSGSGNRTYIRYTTTVTNAGRSSSLSHVVLIENLVDDASDQLPAGSTLVRVTSSRGTCSGSDPISCTIGTLKKGQSATVVAVFTAPSAAGPIHLTATGAFDERFNDQTGGKQDTTPPYVEPTTVSTDADQTFVPKGNSGTFGTDPNQPQSANTRIPNAGNDVVASLDVLPADDFCLDGRVTINGHTYVCRDGAFVESLIVNATGGLYSNSQDPPVYHLVWHSPLTFAFQNRNNFVVFDQETGSNHIDVISARCNNQPPPSSGCLQNINPLADGGWSVDYVKPTDHRMR
jgi:Domain of unknown function DUF11